MCIFCKHAVYQMQSKRSGLYTIANLPRHKKVHGGRDLFGKGRADLELQKPAFKHKVEGCDMLRSVQGWLQTID